MILNKPLYSRTYLVVQMRILENVVQIAGNEDIKCIESSNKTERVDVDAKDNS